MGTLFLILSLFVFFHHQVQEIQETLFKLHDNLNAVQRALDIRRSSEARDRNQAEENNFKVGAWSTFQVSHTIIHERIECRAGRKEREKLLK